MSPHPIRSVLMDSARTVLGVGVGDGGAKVDRIGGLIGFGVGGGTVAVSWQGLGGEAVGLVGGGGIGM